MQYIAQLPRKKEEYVVLRQETQLATPEQLREPIYPTTEDCLPLLRTITSQDNSNVQYNRLGYELPVLIVSTLATETIAKQNNNHGRTIATE